MHKFILIFICIILCFQLSSCNKALPVDKTESSSSESEIFSSFEDTEIIETNATLISVINGKLDLPEEIPEYILIVDMDLIQLKGAVMKTEIKYYSPDDITHFFRNLYIGTQMDKEDALKASGNYQVRLYFCYEDGSNLWLRYDIAGKYLAFNEDYYDISNHHEELIKLISWPY